MTRLAVLSDLHFGLDRFALIQPLLDAVNAAKADLVVLAGDLTHRGRSAEYERAMRFVKGLKAPWIAVPGNHDVPLFNLWRRMTEPYRNWHRFVTGEMFPIWQDGSTQVLAINSVDPLAWQRGLVTPALLARVQAALDPARFNVVVLHHPLQQRPEVDKELTRGAAQALAALEAAGVDLAITGHIHIWQLDWFLDLPRGRPMIQMQMGTALCDRVEDRQNEFAVLDIEPAALTVTRHIAPMDAPPRFHEPVTARYARMNGLWRPV